MAAAVELEHPSAELTDQKPPTSAGITRELVGLRPYQRWLSADALEHWLIGSGFARYAGPGRLLAPTELVE